MVTGIHCTATYRCAEDGGFDVDTDNDLYVHFDHDFDLSISKLHLKNFCHFLESDGERPFTPVLYLCHLLQAWALTTISSLDQRAFS